MLIALNLLFFLGTALLVWSFGSQFMSKKRQKALINRRLTMLDKTTAGTVREALLIETPQVEQREGFDPSRFNPAVLYLQSGLSMPLLQIALLSFFGAAMTMGLSTSVIVMPVLQIAVVPPLAVFIFFYVLKSAKKRRCDKFLEQLPDALDVAVRSLRAGHPFQSSLLLVAEEMPDPVGTEFGLLGDQLAYGSRMDDALETMQKRVPVDDLKYLTMALVIHERSGGNLTHTLRKLSEIIRQRFTLKAKIRTLSSESRFTATLMSLFPLILYFVLSLLMPGYYDPLWESDWANVFVIFCVVMTLMGNAVVKQMTKLEV